MPRTIDPTGNESREAFQPKHHYDYTYPGDFDFRPGTDLHNKIVKMVVKSAEESHEHMQARFTSWDKIDKSLVGYVDLSEQERDDKDVDDRKPMSIVIPVEFAALETLLAYFVSTFLQDPILRYLPAGPEDTIKVALLEKVVNQQIYRMKVALGMHSMWRSAFAYGFGAACVGWRTKKGFRTKRTQERSWSFMYQKFLPWITGAVRESVVQYEGSEIVNIDARNFLPDPNGRLDDPDSMEAVGWVDRDSIMSLLSEEAEEGYDDSAFFNIRYVRDLTDMKSQLFKVFDSSSKYSTAPDPNTTETKPCDIIYRFHDIIPSEIGLGDGDYPETWLFAVAADRVLVQAYKLNYDHNRKPILVYAPEYDGHTTTPFSRLETLYGIQETINFFFSSHIHNVRKALNNITIVDPYMVNYDDVIDPKPGGIWRLRRAAWGRGVENAAKQFPVTDVTKNHVGDVGYMMQMVYDLLGTPDPLRGIMSTGERKSATEARGVQTGGMLRLARLAAICSMQVHNDLGFMFAANTIQFMEKATSVRITGRWEEELRDVYGSDESVMVEPSQIDAFYDMEPHDALFPTAENGDLWVQLFQSISTSEVLAQKFDVVRIFKHVARVLGAKNLSDFEIKANVQAPDQIDQGVDKGNLIPLEEYG